MTASVMLCSLTLVLMVGSFSGCWRAVRVTSNGHVRSREIYAENECTPATPGSGSLVPNDVEVLIISGRLKVRRDGVKFGIRCPRRALGQRCASLPELAFAGVIGRVDEMQLMRHAGALDEIAKPLPLFARVARMIEHDRCASREQVHDKRRQRVAQPARTAHIVRDIQDFAGYSAASQSS